MAVRWATVLRSARARRPPAESETPGMGWVVHCGKETMVVGGSGDIEAQVGDPGCDRLLHRTLLRC